MTLESDVSNPIVITLIDISQALPHADTLRVIYVKPAPEMGMDSNMCLQLIKNLYGVKDAGLGFRALHQACDG